jgi:hypothetical protein
MVQDQQGTASQLYIDSESPTQHPCTTSTHSCINEQGCGAASY